MIILEEARLAKFVRITVPLTFRNRFTLPEFWLGSVDQLEARGIIEARVVVVIHDAIIISLNPNDNIDLSYGQRDNSAFVRCGALR